MLCSVPASRAMTSIMASVVRDMALTHFHLTTQWTLAAAPMAVWDVLARPHAWPHGGGRLAPMGAGGTCCGTHVRYGCA